MYGQKDSNVCWMPWSLIVYGLSVQYASFSHENDKSLAATDPRQCQGGAAL